MNSALIIKGSVAQIVFLITDLVNKMVMQGFDLSIPLFYNDLNSGLMNQAPTTLVLEYFSNIPFYFSASSAFISGSEIVSLVIMVIKPIVPFIIRSIRFIRCESFQMTDDRKPSTEKRVTRKIDYENNPIIEVRCHGRFAV